MVAISEEKVVESKQESIKNTCEYQGELYFVFSDISNGKCFIDVNGERKYLDKNGCVANKQCGTKSIKTAIENFEDMKKIQDLKGNPLLLFINQWSIGMTVDRNKGLVLSEFGRN